MAVVNDILSDVAMNESIIPVGFMSFVEASVYCAEEADYEFKNLLEAVGLGDDSAVNEAVVINESAAEAAVNFFKRMWEGIKAFFAKASAWFTEQAKKAKAAIESKVDDATEKALKGLTKGLSDDVAKAAIEGSDKTFKVHDWKFASDDAGMEVAKALGIAKKALASAATIDDEKIDMLPAMLVGSSDKINVADMKKAYAKTLGAEDKKEIKFADFDYKTAVKYIVNNGNLKGIKGMYNVLRSMVKDAIAEAQKLSKEDKKSKEGANGAAYASIIKYEKLILQCSQAISAVAIDCRRQKFAEDLRIVLAMKKAGMAALKKAEKDEKKTTAAGESVEAQSIFAW